jgi:hypothetical protein
MRTILYAMLAIMALAGFSERSSATPLTVYYDQAAWQAAVSGLAISTISGGATESVTNTTISIAPAPDCPGPGGICLINVQTNSFHVPGFSSVAGINEFPNSDCFDCTRTTRIDFALDQPILGFAADNYSFNNAILTVNGFGIGGGLFGPVPSFFGLVGPISTLSFGSGPCCTDSPARLDMRNFVFAAAVPEPFTVSLFSVGVAGVVATRRRKAKTI